MSKPKNTPWMGTQYLRWVGGNGIVVTKDFYEWHWSTPTNQGWKPTKLAAMRAAMAAVRGAQR